MVTKKNTLIISTAVTFSFFLILKFVGVDTLCGGSQYGDCTRWLDAFFILFLPFIPLVILSVISFFLREEVFRAWMKFVYWWIPLTMFMILISPEYGQELMPVEKGTVAVFFSGIFVIISLIIMVVKSRSKKS